MLFFKCKTIAPQNSRFKDSFTLQISFQIQIWVQAKFLWAKFSAEKNNDAWKAELSSYSQHMWLQVFQLHCCNQATEDLNRDENLLAIEQLELQKKVSSRVWILFAGSKPLFEPFSLPQKDDAHDSGKSLTQPNWDYWTIHSKSYDIAFKNAMPNENVTALHYSVFEAVKTERMAEQYNRVVASRILWHLFSKDVRHKKGDPLKYLLALHSRQKWWFFGKKP